MLANTYTRTYLFVVEEQPLPVLLEMTHVVAVVGVLTEVGNNPDQGVLALAVISLYSCSASSGSGTRRNAAEHLVKQKDKISESNKIRKW